MIGITGSLASGKSSVLKYLGDNGYKVFSSDEVVKNLYMDQAVVNKVMEIFPQLDIFDKKKIAKIICHNGKKRRELENLIHPMIRIEMNKFEESLQDGEIAFAEVPLLFEKNLEHLFSYTIYVSCRKELRLQRAMNRGMDKEIFFLIDSIQLPEKEKRKRADFIVNTEVEKEVWQKELQDILRKLDERNNT